MKDFPIPVVAIGPGAHTEEETLNYLTMPAGMSTYNPPVLPEVEDLVGLDGARAALKHILELLNKRQFGQVSLLGLPRPDLALLNQVLGEGEASAIVQLGAQGLEVRVQESVFAGVWRLMTWHGGELVDDAVEVGPVPELFRAVAAEDVWEQVPRWVGALPPNVQNAPLLIDEVRDQSSRWRPGQMPHVINLTLLPVSPEDIGFLDHHLGTGRVLVLSRGYGNCRISNTRLPNCWRVVYYNSMDKVLLNTVEVVDMPEVAMAAPEDIQDSYERLKDVIAYLEGS